MMDLSELSIGELYALRVEVNNLIEVTEKEAMDKLTQGEEVPGYTLKTGKRTRSIVGTPELVASLIERGIPRKDIYDVKLKGVPALEKLINAMCPDDAEKLLDEHIEVSPGKQKLMFEGVK